MKTIPAAYVHQTRHVPYADAIVDGYKVIETRSRNVLKDFVGERILIIRTQSGKPSEIIGSVTITSSQFCPASDFPGYFNQHCVPPGSRYDCHGRGKWMYFLDDAVKFDAPIPVSSVTIAHKTRSYAIVEM